MWTSDPEKNLVRVLHAGYFPKTFCFHETEIWEYTSGPNEVRNTLISFCMTKLLPLLLAKICKGSWEVGTRENMTAPAFEEDKPNAKGFVYKLLSCISDSRSSRKWVQAKAVQTPKISLPVIKVICKTVPTCREKAHRLLLCVRTVRISAQWFMLVDDTNCEG